MAKIKFFIIFYMRDLLVSARNAIERFVYKNVFKHIFFLIDPETIHNRMVRLGKLLGQFKIARWLIALFFSYSNKKLAQDILGIHFFNPIGLAAGFDKDAELVNILPSVGFGFAEVGSITGEPCAGNPKPRLWRLKRSKGLVVYYGLKNYGCEAIAENLKGKKFKIPIGVSIAKTNSKDTVDLRAGIKDYVKAFMVMGGVGSYVTINISCPNAYGGEPFIDPGSLDKLLKEIFSIPKKKPVFIKLSPDLSDKEIDDIIEIAGKYGIDGFICTNLTKKRHESLKDKKVSDKGGISGKGLHNLPNKVIRYVYQKTKGRYVIIGTGGVFTAEDAYEKIKAGASLVQLITGMIFEGPQVIGEINQGLVRLLEKDGFENISEAVGIENKF